MTVKRQSSSAETSSSFSTCDYQQHIPGRLWMVSKCLMKEAVLQFLTQCIMLNRSQVLPSTHSEDRRLGCEIGASVTRSSMPLVCNSIIENSTNPSSLNITQCLNDVLRSSDSMKYEEACIKLHHALVELAQ